MFHAHSILCRSRLPAIAIHVASHSLFPVGYGYPVVPRIESPFFLIITVVHPAETLTMRQVLEQLTKTQAVFSMTFFQLLARERSLSPGLDGLREDLDISGNLTSTDDDHDIVLAHMAEKIQ